MKRILLSLVLAAGLPLSAMADLVKDSPVRFPEKGALPAKYAPDQPSKEHEPAEEGYYIFSTPERSLAQIEKIQAEMPQGQFSPPEPDWKHLARTRRILNEGGELRLLALGDSIVNDTMRSGWVAKLHQAYPKARIQATVYVRGGGGCQHYKEEGRLAKYVIPRKPDLVIIGGISQKDIESIREVIRTLRAALPEVEIVLATGAFGTADPRVPEELAKAAYSGTGPYGVALRELAREENCAYLDMTTAWAQNICSSKLHPHLFYRDAVHANEFGEQILSKILLAFFAGRSVSAGAAPGPIRVSENGRYFVDANAEPFYFLADTQWELFRRYSLDEARTILENRKAKGFTVVMVMLTGVGDGTGPNLEGQHPWLDNNPATPNPGYFAHVDEVVKLALANDIQLLVGLYHQTYGNRMTMENAKPWAAWVTHRYRDFPNLVWTIYPKATERYRPIVARLAEGILEGDGGRHLISLHPDPAPASSSFWHAEPWLSFNSIQVWNDLSAIYPMTLADYQRTPAKPVAMLEGVYEGGEEYHYPITPLLVRREAYYTCLAGGFHGYGHNDSWRVKPTWKSALDAPGAKEMAVLKQVFTGLPEWWTLVPDQAVLTGGGSSRGDKLNVAARSATGKWIVAYVAGEPTITVNMRVITGADTVSAVWIDPVSGQQEQLGTFSASTRSFTRPGAWEDGVLVVKAETK